MKDKKKNVSGEIKKPQIPPLLKTQTNNEIIKTKHNIKKKKASRCVTTKYLDFVGGPFAVDAGLVVRVHVSVVGVRQDVPLLKFR